MEQPSKCDFLFTKRDLQTLCLAGVRKISKLYEKSAIKKEHCTNCVRIGQGAHNRIHTYKKAREMGRNPHFLLYLSNFPVC